MKRLFYFLLLAALASVAMADVNVTGKWSGSFNITRGDGDSKDSTAVLMLKQTGTDITGSAGPNEDEQFPIRKGTIEGDKITLEVDHDGSTIRFALVLNAANRISGEANMSREGETAKAKVDVTRK